MLIEKSRCVLLFSMNRFDGESFAGGLLAFFLFVSVVMVQASLVFGTGWMFPAMSSMS